PAVSRALTAGGPRLSLGRKGSRVAHAASNPALELGLGAQALGVDPQPSVHYPAAHLEWAGVGLAAQLLGFRRLAAQHQAALSARAHGHVAADQEGQAAEHALLGD